MKLFSNPVKLFSFLFILTISAISCSSGTGKNVKKSQITETQSYISPMSDSGLFSLLNLDFPGMESVKKYAEAGDFIQAKAAYLAFRREKSQTKWNINPADQPSKPAANSFPEANMIMKHIVISSRNAPEAFLGEDINWEFNPVAPDEPHFTREWTWGLNRMYAWDVLGKAYWQTLDEKFAKEWVAQMTDWVEDNPVPLDAEPGGTLTWRTIESGIRMARSWMNAYYNFLNSPSFTPEAHACFIRGIIEHGEKLEKTELDLPDRTGNWVTMECNGLGTIAILFPEFKMSDSFKRTAFERLDKELDKQIYPDGAEIELTPHYHQVSLYNFMRLSTLALKNNISLPEGYIHKMKKMFEYNLYLMDPSGFLPPFNDAGHESIVSSRFEVSGLMEAYDIWKDEKFLFGATLGREGKKPEFDSYYFNWAGYYVMRSGWNYNDNCLYFDAGPLGSGHEHEDMLNLYLYSHGKILLTEGSYSYDKSEWRKFAISTPAHNTIMVDGKEQHRADIPGSRVVKEPLQNPWISTFLFDYGSGTYSYGYQESKYVPVQFKPIEFVGPKDTSVSHTRSVIFLKPYYYVAVDFLEGRGTHKYESHFNLDAPDAKIDEKSKAIQTLRTDSVQLGLFPMDIEKMDVRIVKGQTDPILGWLPNEKRAIPTVVFTKNEEAPAVFSTFIYPYYISTPEVSYSKIPSGNKNIWGKKIITPNETFAIVINREKERTPVGIETGVADPLTTDANVIVIRKLKNMNKEYFGFYDISGFKDKSLDFRLSAAASLVMVREQDGSLLMFNPQDKELKVTFSVPLKKKFTLRAGSWITVSSTGISEYDKPVTLF
jgi:hypothetical protein